MASYLEQYQPVRTQAFHTDTQGIIQGLAQKDAYWRQGVQQVQNAYEQASGLQLTGQTAKERLSNFMQSADGQLKKILASDVSMYDNAAKASELYQPLYKDLELMSNNSVTKHYANQFNQINNWRTKDNGKYYSDANYQDVLNSYSDFKNGVDGGQSAQGYTDKLRSYTPYYDYTKESLDLLSKCKPSSTSVQGQSPSSQFYLETRENESLTPSHIAGCLGSLSDKAKNQLTIDERVRYHNRPQDLARAWSNIGEKDVDALQKNLVQARLNLTASQNDPKSKEYFNQLVTSLTSQLYDKQSNLAAINRGDYSDVLNNFDQYAFQTGVMRHASQFGNAYAYEKTSSEYTPNVAALQRDRQNFEVQQSNVAWARQQQRDDLQFGRDKEIANLNNNNAIKLKFLEKYGWMPDNMDEAFKGFKAGYFGGNDTPQLTTTATDLAVDKAGLDVYADLQKQSESLVNISKQAGNQLQNALFENPDPVLSTDLGINQGRTFNPNLNKDKAGMLSTLHAVINNYNKIEAQNRTLPIGSPQAPNYKQSSIDAIRAYIKTIEDSDSQMSMLNKMNSLAQQEVNNKVGPEDVKLTNELANLSVTVPGAGRLTGSDMQRLITTGTSGAFSLRKLQFTGKDGNLNTEKDPYHVSPLENIKDIYNYRVYYNGKALDDIGRMVGSDNVIDLLQKVYDRSNEYTTKRNEVINQVYSQAIAEGRNVYGFQGADATKTKQINDEAAALVKDIVRPLLAAGKSGDDRMEMIRPIGYLRDGRLVVNTGTEKIDPTTLPISNGIAFTSGGNNLIAFDAPTLKRYTGISDDNQGLRNNENVRMLNTMFEKYAPIGKYEDIQETPIYRPRTQQTEHVKIRATKNQQGLPIYSIQRYSDNGWDNVKSPGFSNITDFREATQKYNLFIDQIRNN